MKSLWPKVHFQLTIAYSLCNDQSIIHPVSSLLHALLCIVFPQKLTTTPFPTPTPTPWLKVFFYFCPTPFPFEMFDFKDPPPPLLFPLELLITFHWGSMEIPWNNTLLLNPNQEPLIRENRKHLSATYVELLALLFQVTGQVKERTMVGPGTRWKERHIKQTRAQKKKAIHRQQHIKQTRVQNREAIHLQHHMEQTRVQKTEAIYRQHSWMMTTSSRGWW